MNKLKYSDKDIRKAVKKSKSVTDVMRHLGINYLSGSMHSWIKQRIKRLNLDTSHFTGQGHQKGNRAPNRKNPGQILIFKKFGRRTKVVQIRRALIEISRAYRCELCGNSGEWLGQKLRLQVDHINGNPLDDRRENLRFLCPNCHSQQ